MKARRLMVVTYFFPPVGGIGVQRTLKHLTYLPDAGWTPVVIAPRGAAYRVMDPASVADLPAGLEVHRSPCYEPARLRRQVRDTVRAARRGLSPSSSPSAEGAAVGLGGGGTSPRLNDAWARTIRFLFFPDDQLLWVPFAVRSALHAHRRNPVTAIYSSSPPVSTHLIAGLLKRRIGVPWVVDFRDPWIGNSFAPRLSGFQRRLQVRLERWIVRSADWVVFATPGLLDRYQARYPEQAERFVVIPNGYDAAELADILPAPRAPDGTVRLVYTGSVYGEREMAVFLEGLTLTLDRRPELRDRLRVEFIGWMTDANRRSAEDVLSRLAPVLELSGQVPRPEALARLRASDAALLLLADGPDRDLFVGGKLFEYLGLGRQVLAVAPPGDARRLLAELDWGIVADPEPEAIAAALERLMETPAPTRQADPEGRYERRNLAARLGALLDKATDS